MLSLVFIILGTILDLYLRLEFLNYLPRLASYMEKHKKRIMQSLCTETVTFAPRSLPILRNLYWRDKILWTKTPRTQTFRHNIKK